MTVNRRVLVVHPERSRCASLASILRETCEVHVASDAREVDTVCTAHGPFAVVLVHIALPPEGGIPVLRQFQRTWPATTRLVAADQDDFDLLVRALHEGEVARFLRDEELEDCVVARVGEGLARFQQSEDERLLTEQLQFSRESLLELTEALEDRLRRKIAFMTGFKEFSANLSRARSLDEVADLAASACSQLLGGRGVKVLLSDPERRSSATVARGDVGAQAVAKAVETAHGTVGRIEVNAAAGPQRFGDEEQRILDTLAASAGVAADNLIHLRERDHAQTITIFALARLAENRDDDTGKHLERVCSYCRLIAEGLREDGHFTDVLSDDWIHDLVQSAPLHDIGKVGIPDSILLKPGKLTDEEWEVMRSHTNIGAETLARILENSGEQSYLRMGYDIALCHHERWNGSGYPAKLEGDAIPLSARILALADCYDALTTRRPYKEPWTHAKALELVISEKGEHFDPRVVDAFVARQEKADQIRYELADDPVLKAS